MLCTSPLWGRSTRARLCCTSAAPLPHSSEVGSDCGLHWEAARLYDMAFSQASYVFLVKLSREVLQVWTGQRAVGWPHGPQVLLGFLRVGVARAFWKMTWWLWAAHRPCIGKLRAGLLAFMRVLDAVQGSGRIHFKGLGQSELLRAATWRTFLCQPPSVQE